MKRLIIGFVTIAVLMTGALFAGTEAASSCSAKLPDGTESCSVTCETGETAVCGRNDAQVWCHCEASSSSRMSDEITAGASVDTSDDTQDDGGSNSE